MHPLNRRSMLQICEVIDCGDKVQASLLCQKHYRTYRRWKVSGKVSTLGAFVGKLACKK